MIFENDENWRGDFVFVSVCDVWCVCVCVCILYVCVVNNLAD